MLALLLLEGDEDAVANFAFDSLGEVPFPGRVLDEDDLAGRDRAALAIARGDLHTSVEIDDVLPPWCRVPVEVVSRRDFAEDDPGRQQALRKLSAACFLGPFDLDVPEMRLAARIGVEVVYPHRRVSREVGFEAAY